MKASSGLGWGAYDSWDHTTNVQPKTELFNIPRPTLSFVLKFLVIQLWKIPTNHNLPYSGLNLL